MRTIVVWGGSLLSLTLALPLASPARVLAQEDAPSLQEDAFSLQGLVVTASPTPRAAASVASHVTVVSGDELRAEGVTSVAEALRSVAGVEIVRQGSFGGLTSLFVRGGESDHTLVLVDGVQVNQAGGGFDLAGLTTDNVERIEIVRGPASALYGSDAMAGVIHVVTRTGRGAPRVTARAETSLYSEPSDRLVDGVRWSADASGGSDRYGFSAAISHEKQEGILAFNNRFLSTVASASGRFAPDTRTDVALMLRITDRESHYPTDGSGQVVDRNQFGFADETLARLVLARRVTDAIELEASFSVNETDGGTDDAPDGPTDSDGYQALDHFRRATGQLRASATLGDLVLSLGGELEQERQRSFSESLSTFGSFYGRSRTERENLAGFAHVTGERGPVSFNAGARLEDNQRFGSIGTWQVGAAARLPASPGTRLRASLGTGIKEPTFYENFVADGFSVGNPALDPERSRAWELGVEHVLATGVMLQATYFDQRLRDLIQYVFPAPAPGAPNFFNVAEASARGLEVGAEARVGVLDVGAWYAWLDTNVIDAGFDTGAEAYFVEGEPLLRRPTSTLSLRLVADVAQDGRLHSSLSHVGARLDRRFDPTTFVPERVELSGHLLWTLGMTWQVVESGPRRPSLAVSVRAENLLDERYEEAFGFPAPGRQLHLGFTTSMGGGLD